VIDSISLASLGFPVWLRTAHWVNALFIGFLIRAGIQIFGALPKLYLNDNATPGTEWLRLTRKKVPTDRLWISLEEEIEVPAILAQPGGNNLGMGRHWHFFAAIFWIINGLVYIGFLATSGEWRRLIPTSWSILPDAGHAALSYATLHLPSANTGHLYDPLQQLAYASVVFVLAPLLIATGAAQSPAIAARFPWYTRLFGGQQGARSLHFLGMVAFVLFVIVHTALVLISGAGNNLSDITLGQHAHDRTTGVIFAAIIIATIVAIYGLTSWYSRTRPRDVQRALGAVVNAVRRGLFLHVTSRQQYPASAISPVFRINGYPPKTSEYDSLLANGFRDWRLRVVGLVEEPLELTMDDLRSMPKTNQITKHVCIQGWSAVGEWGGVLLTELLARCRPLATARYLVFRSLQMDASGQPFYESLDVRLARHPQSILAYEFNRRPLPVPHGAPLRLRVETQLGFKMVKWLREIELVEEYRGIRDGQGGSREDNMYYDAGAGI
jgi:DMSO/TMAO reductase YedYZ molybdopterin-dependent catalytic subunit/thiosulfate reductase cytochrome b subunit